MANLTPTAPRCTRLRLLPRLPLPLLIITVMPCWMNQQPRATSVHTSLFCLMMIRMLPPTMKHVCRSFQPGRGAERLLLPEVVTRQSHSSVDEGDDGKEIKNPLQEESDTEGVESECGEHHPSTITTAMQEEDMATESTDVGSLFLFSAPAVVLRNHETNPSFDDPALCPHTLKTIRDTYDLRGVNTKLNGKQVLPPIVISPNKLRETFRMRDPSESNVMVAAPPLDTVRRYLHLYGNKWTENTSAELVDLYMNTPKDSRGMINIGYATLSQAATGPYLQRLNPDAERRGIRVPAEKKVHRNFQKATRGREMLHHLNCGLQNLTELQLLLPKEVEDSLAFPSPEDVRAAIETSWRNNGLDIPEEPFPGLVHQSVTLGDNGASTRSPKVTSFHTDETNAGVLAKVYPDFHYLLTDNDDMLYVVNVETEDGNIQPCCFTQRQGTMVAFRAGNCDHGSVDKFTYLSTLTQEVGHSHSSKEALAGCRRHCDVASKPRVFCTAYTRFSLLDHAWELRAWEKAGVSPYYVVAGTTGNTRPKVPAASIKKVSDEHGLESPYMSEYKKPIYLEGRYAF